MTLFGVEEHPLLDEIRAAKLEELSPDRRRSNYCESGSSGWPKTSWRQSDNAAITSGNVGRVGESLYGR